jgi:hypothetical protein
MELQIMHLKRLVFLLLKFSEETLQIPCSSFARVSRLLTQLESAD